LGIVNARSPDVSETAVFAILRGASCDAAAATGSSNGSRFGGVDGCVSSVKDVISGEGIGGVTEGCCNSVETSSVLSGSGTSGFVGFSNFSVDAGATGAEKSANGVGAVAVGGVIFHESTGTGVDADGVLSEGTELTATANGSSGGAGGFGSGWAVSLKEGGAGGFGSGWAVSLKEGGAGGFFSGSFVCFFSSFSPTGLRASSFLDVFFNLSAGFCVTASFSDFLTGSSGGLGTGFGFTSEAIFSAFSAIAA
jgi:hypothetical protein